ncbi:MULTISPECIES: PucR family transcriptional regulator [Oceanobacillus]|uniref:Transcriptional activator AdeR n=1 Tax=Oceanobacillus kimchii TaxID=746691 RepID=A0ABQ5TM76_9BACI|nr:MULTISPECIES: helix-turn-helix domain-containing protein [Oceanobacillus]MBT2599697.1 PucR family transcriptional regulator [Oceanobacillus sp. ISL-74]GLO67926.1 transcriptional activator AdeR [Oceanobacillus kimchii]
MNLNIDILHKRLNDIVTSPNQLADNIADLFECPITIEDSNHHVISYSQHKDDIDQVRISTIINRKVPDKVINAFWKKGYMPKLIDSDDPVVIPEIQEVGLGNRIAISVRKQNEILGFIWAHTSDKTFTEAEISLFKEAATYVKKYFLKNRQHNRKSEEGYRDFFWQLLRGDLQNTDDINRQAKQYNIQLQDDKTIVVIRFSDEVNEQMEKHAYYLSESQVKVNVITRLFDDNDFIMLVGLPTQSDSKQSLYEFIQQFIHRIGEQLNLNNVLGAGGLRYEQPQLIGQSYQQAKNVLKLQQLIPERINDILLYEDLGVLQFIDMLAETRKDEHYYNPYMERLRSYDNRHQTSLLETLDIYLQCDSNVYRAAKKLFVHPNTMNYRLKRIKEVSGIDLKNANQKTNIYLDLLIDSIQKT